MFRDRPQVVQPAFRLALQLKLTLNFSTSPALRSQARNTAPGLVSARQQAEGVVHASKHCSTSAVTPAPETSFLSAPERTVNAKKGIGSFKGGKSSLGTGPLRSSCSERQPKPALLRALSPGPAPVEAKIRQMCEGGVGIVKTTQEYF